MAETQIHSKFFGGNKTLGFTSKILFALGVLFFFGLSNSAWAMERDGKALEEKNRIDFSNQEASAPFYYNPSQEKDYIFGNKMNFEIFTFWSTPNDKLKSERLINRFYDRNEFLVKPETSIDKTTATLLEIRF